MLWRNSSGLLADWFMNGSQISGSGYINVNGTLVMPDPSWSIAGIGDLNGDHNSDILWRDTNTGQLSEWLMLGNVLGVATTTTSGGATVNPDLSWTTQAKPTNFA